MDKKCSIEGCDRNHWGKGYCEKHYKKNIRTSTYISWQCMKDRCYNKNSNNYWNWGGRGITVCETWVNNFKQFVFDMGEKPTPNHSIDRINNDGNYCKENCRWATPLEQSNNRRRTFFSSPESGISLNNLTKKWRLDLTIEGQQKYFGTFKDFNSAVKRKHEILIK